MDKKEKLIKKNYKKVLMLFGMQLNWNKFQTFPSELHFDTILRRAFGFEDGTPPVLRTYSLLLRKRINWNLNTTLQTQFYPTS